MAIADSGVAGGVSVCSAEISRVLSTLCVSVKRFRGSRVYVQTLATKPSNSEMRSTVAWFDLGALQLPPPPPPLDEHFLVT